MSKARPIYPGAVLFSTRRTHKRQFLLRPSDEVNNAILYIIAVLAMRHRMLLHALCVMSNHKHDVSTDELGHIVEFERECHALIAGDPTEGYLGGPRSDKTSNAVMLEVRSRDVTNEEWPGRRRSVRLAGPPTG